MKYLVKFNEGFFDRFRTKEKNSEFGNIEDDDRIRIDGSEYFARESMGADGKRFLIFHKNGMRPVASLNDKMVLQIYSSDYDDIKKVKGSKVKVKSVEQALKYLQKLDDKQKQKIEDISGSFDIDISNEEY
jgi:hypothetical protein